MRSVILGIRSYFKTIIRQIIRVTNPNEREKKSMVRRFLKEVFLKRFFRFFELEKSEFVKKVIIKNNIKNK